MAEDIDSKSIGKIPTKQKCCLMLTSQKLTRLSKAANPFVSPFATMTAAVLLASCCVMMEMRDFVGAVFSGD